VTEVLNLTITPSSTNTTTAASCDSYTWSVNGQTYTASGSYSAAVGCVTEVLNLTITPSSTNTTIAGSCDSYTWSVNGQTYTTSGTYSAVVGCVTEVLNLTITPSSTNTTSAASCDSYTWSVNGQTYTTSGSYSAVVGCVTEVLNLTITEAPDASFAYAQSVYCQGDASPDPWTAQPDGVFAASPNGLVIDATTGTINIAQSLPGTYTITYAFGSSCPTSSQQVITVAENADASWSAPAAVCGNASPIDLNSMVTGTPGGTWSGEGISNGLFDPEGLTGIITIIYEASIGACSATSEQHISIQAPIHADAGPDQAICGLTSAMQASPGSGQGTWITPAGITLVGLANDPLAGMNATSHGTYVLIWQVVQGTCTDMDTVHITFIDPLSDLWVNAGPDQDLAVIDHTILHGSSVPGATLHWTVLSGSATIAHPTDTLTAVSDLGIGDNLIMLTASVGQCSSVSDTILIHVQDLFIPEGFSPNDDGVNDKWAVTGIEVYPGSSLRVFSRWGQLVYESDSYTNEWDGRSLNGISLPDDTYFYVLNLNGRSTYNGHVIIKR
jgi:gliding motility-associated-like protein